jgi:hypothetical protein
MAKEKRTSGKRKSKASSNDATTTDKRHGKRKSEKSDDIMIMPLGDHQVLIVPFLMGFLDVPTLVSLGSTSKKNQEHLSEQIAQRKSRFKTIQNKISNELLAADNLVSSREEVHRALGRREEACRLIDSGLGWIDHGGDNYASTSVCSCCSRDRLFADERKLLTPHRSGDIAEHFLMLPTSFYLSKNQISEDSSTDDTPPSEELIKRLRLDSLGYLWHSEEDMNSAHESTAFSPFFSKMACFRSVSSRIKTVALISTHMKSITLPSKSSPGGSNKHFELLLVDSSSKSVLIRCLVFSWHLL